MQVSILGPVRVGAAGEIPGAGVRALLARLALAPGRVVGVETIVDDLWAGPPANPANAVQAAASRLRKALNGHPVTVDAVAGGYRLAVARGDVDAAAADALLAGAAAALRDGDPAAAAAGSGQALDLWRGEPLADVGDAPFAPVEAVRLATLRLDLRRTRIEADLRRGSHADLPAELAGLVDDHPLDEALLGQLMRALVATGRSAEALAAYEDGRERLAEAFGADPGPQLRDVHLAVLTHDRPALRLGPESLIAPAAPDAPAGRSRAGPAARGCAVPSPRCSAATTSWRGSRRCSTTPGWSRCWARAASARPGSRPNWGCAGWTAPAARCTWSSWPVCATTPTCCPPCWPRSGCARSAWSTAPGIRCRARRSSGCATCWPTATR